MANGPDNTNRGYARNNEGFNLPGCLTFLTWFGIGALGLSSITSLVSSEPSLICGAGGVGGFITSVLINATPIGKITKAIFNLPSK